MMHGSTNTKKLRLFQASSLLHKSKQGHQ